MTRTALFLTNRTQALRLPKDVAFPANVHEVTILREGSRRVIVPVDASWDDFFGAPGIDIGDREQPLFQERDPFC
jgi:antitoxin VapB